MGFSLAEQEKQRAAEQDQLIRIASQLFGQIVGGYATAAGPNYPKFLDEQQLAANCVGYARTIVAACQPKDEL